MVQQLRAPAVLVKDLGSLPITHTVLLTLTTSGPGELTALASIGTSSHVHTPTNTHTHH